MQPSASRLADRQGAKGKGGQDCGRKYLSYPVFSLPRELLGDPQAWPLLLASCLVPGVLQLTFLPLVPESPRYLLIDRGDTSACLTGESLPLGPRPRLIQGCISLDHISPHFLGFIY
jgi:hypothetical protein